MSTPVIPVPAGNGEIGKPVNLRPLISFLSPFGICSNLKYAGKDDGWYEVRQKGSHKQFKHPSKSGVVTISYHKLSDEIAPGTLNSILKQADIKE